MTARGSRVPGTARAVLGIHAAWGLFLWLGYAWLGQAAQVARPLLVTSWFGTTALLLVFGLVVASAGWRTRETRYLAALLLFDVAGAAVVVELIRTG